MAKIDLATIDAGEPKTLLSKMGFADGDLTTPLHDEIMLWLDAGLRDPAHSPHLADKLWPEFRENGFNHLMDLKLIWEKPISNKRTGFIVGYADMWAEARIKYEERFYLFEVKSRISSLGELLRQMQTYREHLSRDSYESKRTEYWIVCPDDRFAEPLRAQGINFLKYGNA